MGTLDPQPAHKKIGVPTGPIPGENYTSNTKNYPWHRPPSITNIDDAIEFSAKALTDKDRANSVLTMLQAGMSVVQVTDLFVSSGIMSGYWTPDYALLLAGPVSHIIKLMGDGYGIKYDMGLSDNPRPTINFLKAASGIDPKKAVDVAHNVASMTEAFKSEAESKLHQMGQGNPTQPGGQPGFGLMGSPDQSVNAMGSGGQPGGGFMGGQPPPQGQDLTQAPPTPAPAPVQLPPQKNQVQPVQSTPGVF